MFGETNSDSVEYDKGACTLGILTELELCPPVSLLIRGFLKIFQYIIYPCIIGFIGKSFQFFVKFFLVFRSPFGEDAFSQVHKPDEVVVE